MVRSLQNNSIIPLQSAMARIKKHVTLMLLLRKIRLYNIKLFLSVFDEVMSQLIKILKN